MLKVDSRGIDGVGRADGASPLRVEQRHDAPHRGVLMLGTSPEMRGGVAAVVAILRDCGLFEREHVRYVVTHVDGSRWRKLAQFVGAAARVLRVLLSGNVSIVHAHVSANGSFWRKAALLWVARRFGCATVFHLHDGNFERYVEHGFGGPLLRWCIRRTIGASDVVIVLSERWAKWMRQFSPRSRVHVIGNPVRLPPQDQRLPAVGDKPAASSRVLFLGMICDAKGSFDLLRAFAIFRSQTPGWRLVVGGNGEVERFLEQAKSLGVRDDVDYLGWVSGDEKNRALAAADIFVLPSYGEGMPVSLLEAMAYACAVIATPVGGVPDMMTPESHGLWIEPGDVAGLAAALERVAGSPELRASLGAAARQHVLAEYAAATVSEKISQAYDDALLRMRAQ